MRELWLTCALAGRDWTFEKLLSACAVLALASVLTPILILFGVRYGVISALQERLMQDPAILTVTPVGSGSGYTKEWLATLQSRPDVRFAVLRTRDIAATIQLFRETPPEATGKTGNETRLVRVSMEPTGEGDPLLVRAGLFPADDNAVVLSASAARKLGLTPESGATGGPFAVIHGQLGRKRPDGGLESVSWPLTVSGILPLEAEDKDVAFVRLSLLEDAENFRDYIAVPSRGLTGDTPPADEGAGRRYAGFRLYAANLDAVEPLRALFASQGIDVVTKAREIGFVSGLDRSLTLVFSLVALTAGAGCMASTASSVLAAVRRKDKQLGMLRLIGFSSLSIMAYPLVQALMTGLLGTLLAGVVYLGVSYGIDRLFAEQLFGMAVCRITPWHFVLTLGIVLLLSALSAVQASLRAARIEPSDVLREI